VITYQMPIISSVELEPLRSKLQNGVYLTPDCSSGTQCDDDLGFDQAEVGQEDTSPCSLSVSFFLEGRTDSSDPTDCIVRIQDSVFGSQAGISCQYELDVPLASCSEGQVWEVICFFPGIDPGGCAPSTDFDNVIVDCGVNSDNCPDSEE